MAANALVVLVLPVMLQVVGESDGLLRRMLLEVDSCKCPASSLAQGRELVRAFIEGGQARRGLACKAAISLAVCSC